MTKESQFFLHINGEDLPIPGQETTSDETARVRPLPIKRKPWRPRWVPFAGQDYYIPDPTYSVLVRHYKWTSADDPQDRDFLQKGLVFENFEEAENVALKMIKLAKVW